MKKTFTTAMAASLLALLGTSCSTCNDEGWTSLFNEGLSNAVYNKNVWTIEDGVLTANKDEIIFTKADYANFELELEFKIEKNSNSGVVVYCTDIQKWIPNSLEIQIADNKNISFAKPTWRCASIFGHVDPKFDTTVPYGEWQKLCIICKGKNIDVWLNGKHASHMDMLMWKDNKMGPDGTIIPSWLTSQKKCDMPTLGKIGLQGKHGKASTQYRNIRIRQLAK